MTIISVSGLIGSGKDTIATHLIENYGFKKRAFADPLKDAVAAIFGWDRKMLEGATPEARAERDREDHWWTDKLDFGFPVTPRWVLQNFGTEVMRKNFNDDIWVLAMERFLATVEKNVVITDTRFLNEFFMLKSREAVLLTVFRGHHQWMKKFYHYVDDYLAAEDLEVGDIKWMRLSDRQLLVAAADLAAKRVAPNLHVSEYQHLVWPAYDLVLHNSKRILHLTSSVDRLWKRVELPKTPQTKMRDTGYRGQGETLRG